MTLITGLIVHGQYVQAQQTFSVASPRQVIAAIQGCMKSKGQPDDLGQMNWYPEQVPSSTLGMAKYFSRTNPVWMAVPDKSGGETVCWVMAAASNGRSDYEQSISDAVGAQPKIDAQSSGWITKSHFLMMDWVSQRDITGMRIEVHRIRP